MVTPPTTSQDRPDGHVTEIQQRVERGEYRVDTQAVAEAILRRLLGGGDLWPGAPRAQDPCS